jgi:putative ABC transport system permease protein
MMDVLLLTKIGWRNLWRHPRGTLLTALASGLGLTLLLVSLGLLDGSHEQMVSNAVRFGTGHVVIQAQGYQDSGSQDLLLPPGAAPAAEAYFNTAAGKDVLRGFSPRLVASGLLSSPANADGVRIMGVIPKAEHDVSLIPQRIVEGAYLGKDQKSGVVIGAELARKLGVKVGSKVVLMTQAVASADPGAQATPSADPSAQATPSADPGAQAAPSADPGAAAAGGEMQSAMLRVTGIFRTGVQAIDAHVIQMPLADAQALLGTPGRVTQIAIRLQRERDSLAVAQSLRKQFTGVPAEILPWREAMPSVAQLFVLDDAFNYVMNGVVLAMVALGILNTILMRVLERRHEFGICSALGLRPMQFAIMIIGESLALTAISLTLGLVLGLGIDYYFATRGLDLRWFFRSSLPSALVFDPIIYSRLSPMRISSSVAIVLLTTTVISFYPAYKAARTKLPGALRVY